MKIIYRENHLYKNNKSSIDDREVGFFPYSRVEIILDGDKIKFQELASADGKEWITLTERQA